MLQFIHRHPGGCLISLLLLSGSIVAGVLIVRLLLVFWIIKTLLGLIH